MKKQAELRLNLSTRRTRKAVFLDEMELVVPSRERIALIAAASPVASTGHPLFAREMILRVYFLQQWFGLSDLTLEEALFETPLYRDLAGLSVTEHIPDRVSILRFGHLLEEHQRSLKILAAVNSTQLFKGLLLKSCTATDATLNAASSSSKNNSGKRDPEMHQTNKVNQWHFGMKAHICVDTDSGLVLKAVGTAANVKDVTQASSLLHGEETDVFADLRYQGVAKREETQSIEERWDMAMRPGKRKAVDKATPMGAVLDKLKHLKASIQTKVEHPFRRVIKRQFGHVKVRYRRLMKNTTQLRKLFAFCNHWMACHRPLQRAQGRVRMQCVDWPGRAQELATNQAWSR